MVEYGDLITLALKVVITVLLPILLKELLAYANAGIKEYKARTDTHELATVIEVVRQLVLAAEMNGLSGAIEAIGAEKKKFVLDLAQAELARRGIDLDLDMLDALIEAQVKEAIKDLEPLTETP